jgi:hypothetical protein
MTINQVTRRHANDAKSVIMMMMEEGGESPQELVHSDWSKQTETKMPATFLKHLHQNEM